MLLMMKPFRTIKAKLAVHYLQPCIATEGDHLSNQRKANELTLSSYLILQLYSTPLQLLPICSIIHESSQEGGFRYGGLLRIFCHSVKPQHSFFPILSLVCLCRIAGGLSTTTTLESRMGHRSTIN